MELKYKAGPQRGALEHMPKKVLGFQQEQLMEKESGPIINNELIKYAISGNLNQIKRFIEESHNVNITSESGITLLEGSCLSGNVSLVSYILNFNPIVRSFTASPSKIVASELKKHGIDCFIFDEKHMFGKKQAIEYLISHNNPISSYMNSSKIKNEVVKPTKKSTNKSNRADIEQFKVYRPNPQQLQTQTQQLQAQTQQLQTQSQQLQTQSRRIQASPVNFVPLNVPAQPFSNQFAQNPAAMSPQPFVPIQMNYGTSMFNSMYHQSQEYEYEYYEEEEEEDEMAKGLNENGFEGDYEVYKEGEIEKTTEELRKAIAEGNYKVFISLAKQNVSLGRGFIRIGSEIISKELPREIERRLMEAGMRGDEKEIGNLRSLGVMFDANARGIGGDTALHAASQSGHVKAVEALLDIGADPDALNHSGYSPSEVACIGGHLDVIKAFVERGIDINFNFKINSGKNPHQKPLLEFAEISGNEELIMYLLGKGFVEGIEKVIQITNNPNIKLILEEKIHNVQKIKTLRRKMKKMNVIF